MGRQFFETVNLPDGEYRAVSNQGTISFYNPTKRSYKVKAVVYGNLSEGEWLLTVENKVVVGISVFE